MFVGSPIIMKSPQPQPGGMWGWFPYCSGFSEFRPAEAAGLQANPYFYRHSAPSGAITHNEAIT